jgi:uncharacterized protein (DUF983 family)
MAIAEEDRAPGQAGNRGPRQVSALHGILRQLCPRCRQGKIFHEWLFRSFPRMRETCTVCGLKFEREEGYFLGAMYISYGLALVAIAALSLLVWKLSELPFERIVLWGFILFLPLVFPITIFSRVLWIYLDRTIDPERPAAKPRA